MKRPPLRLIMLVPTLITVLVGFGAFAIYIDTVERSNLLADIDDELVRAERAGDNRPSDAADLAAANRTASPSDNSVAPPVQLIVSTTGEVLSPPDDNPLSNTTLADLTNRTGTITITDPNYRVRITAEDNGTVTITALSLDRFDDSITDFRQTLVVGGTVILLLIAAVIWFLTERAVRPVTQMAATATRIGHGDLQADVNAESGSRETFDLATALELMLTELRSTIDDREHAALSAQESRDAMRRFLADVSHELRTPLTALKGYSDLYVGGMLDEPGALDRAMSRIGDESERLNGLVTNMLQLARETPTHEATEPFDAAHVVDVVVTDLSAAHPNVEIRLQIEPEAHTTITGRAARFHQAILNLGTNACRHTAPDTPVEFFVRSNDTQLLVEVLDHGTGIDPREADKIFLPFYRPETSRERDSGGGAGLGLAITHQIVEQHLGTITVEPTAGGGATFIVAIPLLST